jgi:hypothetical protein
MVLYHVHFDVADVPTLERRYICDGFEVVARYGYVGREHRSFGPEVGWDELERMGVRLRLVELESGAVNVVVMRGKNEAALTTKWRPRRRVPSTWVCACARTQTGS